ncbi:MAG: 3-deoxy-7-phosphoheptulonate synthase, partial [Proteobacteria bacterium]
MIVILQPEVSTASETGRRVLEYLKAKPGITPRIHEVTGVQQVLSEIYLVGDTASLDRSEIESLPGVDSVVKVSRSYAVLGRHADDTRSYGFDYNGVRFDQDSLRVFAGLCAVDNRKHVEIMMKAVSQRGLECTRMGAYKPRTNPYSFQGLGADCLPWVFELAGKYGIKVVAMEITHDSHVDEILETLETTGHPTGVMLQIGTRNTQNFELLKHVGRQRPLPVLI